MTSSELFEPSKADVRMVAVQKAVRLLDAAGCRYKILGSDIEFGDLLVMPPKSTTRVRRNRGMYKHYQPIIQVMKPGDVRRLPCPAEYDIEAYRGSISAYACSHWGKESAITRKIDNDVEIIRIY
jgi:hypothetical protein